MMSTCISRERERQAEERINEEKYIGWIMRDVIGLRPRLCSFVRAYIIFPRDVCSTCACNEIVPDRHTHDIYIAPCVSI